MKYVPIDFFACTIVNVTMLARLGINREEITQYSLFSFSLRVYSLFSDFSEMYFLKGAKSSQETEAFAVGGMKWAMRNMKKSVGCSTLVEKKSEGFSASTLLFELSLWRNMLRKARSRALGQKLSTYLVMHRCLSDRFAPSRRHRKSGLLLNRLWSLIHVSSITTKKQCNSF